jgi:hypothetical protein
MRRLALTSSLLALTLVAGCDMLGIESPEKLAASREADGKAIGGACRHAGRAIEDCYTLNRKADRAAVFAGWRDMNDYMRENKIDPVPPQLATAVTSSRSKSIEPPEESTPPSGKPAGKSTESAKAKGQQS